MHISPVVMRWASAILVLNCSGSAQLTDHGRNPSIIRSHAFPELVILARKMKCAHQEISVPIEGGGGEGWFQLYPNHKY